MHILQPKHVILKPEEAELLLQNLNISRSQLPKIKINDAALPSEAKIGDIIQIERKAEEGKTIYFRIVVA